MPHYHGVIRLDPVSDEVDDLPAQFGPQQVARLIARAATAAKLSVTSPITQLEHMDNEFLPQRYQHSESNAAVGMSVRK